MSKILYPLSLIYSFFSDMNRDLKKVETLSKPVISVGNITWGGTGKTPMTMELLEFLIENNKKPVVLTRGYGRRSKTPMLLQNGAKGIDPLDSGDEALLIAKSIPKADIVIGADRYNSALKYEKETNPDVYVLDDGFQHWKLERNLDIVCINAANPFGNGMLIPAGILREKPKELLRAGVIIITNSDMVSEEELSDLERKIFVYSGRKAVITYYGDYKYKHIDLFRDFNTDLLKENKVYSLSGIGFADGFKNSIKRSGIKIEDSIVMSDHKEYNIEIINNIFNRIGKNSYLIITSKDAVKLENILNDEMKEKIAVLKVKPIFKTERQQWEKTVLKSLQHF